MLSWPVETDIRGQTMRIRTNCDSCYKLRVCSPYLVARNAEMYLCAKCARDIRIADIVCEPIR